MLRLLSGIVGLILAAIVLVDLFHTIVLPRRVRGVFRITRVFYRWTWRMYSVRARRKTSGRRREEYLSMYGPLSLLTLLACWAVGLMVAFGFLQWALGLRLDGRAAGLGAAISASASSLFTLVFATPENPGARTLMVIEAGMGLSLFGLVVGYLPVLYQSYSSRELRISLLDARAGSPPAAAVLLSRQSGNPDKLEHHLAEWEEWMAELLEEQLSYPMLAYFRSQHQNQSWLGALTAMLDASALVSLASDGDLKRQAQLTFAMGRHALVDLATVFRAEPTPPRDDRLTSEEFARLREILRNAAPLQVERISESELLGLRGMYEPYAHSLGMHFLIALPSWLATEKQENWLRTEWEHSGDPFAVSDPYQRK